MSELEPTQPPIPGTSPGISTIEDVDVSTLLGKPHNVILFNDEDHSFEDVVIQVIAAVKCSPSKAATITLDAHKNGKTVAFSGHLERCEVIEAALSGPPLKLRTEIERA